MLLAVSGNERLRATVGRTRAVKRNVYACALVQHDERSGRTAERAASSVERRASGSFRQHAAGTNHYGSDERASSNAFCANATERSTAAARLATTAGRRRTANARAEHSADIFDSDD